MTLPPGAKLGPYEIVALLGAGGMGEVYRGRDSRLNRDVALKVLLPNFAADTDRMARFQREAQVLASLNHPHIAALYGLEDAGGVRALVMELVEGPTLSARIKTGPIPIEEALTIARQIAEALEFAHDRGIIHRDLKPANVKLTLDNAVKVLDFGLAKALDDRPAPGSDPANSPTLTMGATVAGVILGTAGYMPPEQAKGGVVDRRADIWAFGVVLMEMLTGRTLYRGGTVAETLAAVLLTEPAFDTLPADTPESIRKLIRRCLEKDPRRRLQAIGEARIAIEEAGVEQPPQPPPAAPRRPILPWVAASVAAACALVLALIHFREAPPPVERVLQYSIPAPEKSRIHSFAVSPDGRYLAIAAAIAGKRQLWIHPLDRQATKPLVGAEDAMFPFWSPDSRSIGFFAAGKLKRISIEGGLIQTLSDAVDGRGGTWNRDGIIVFAPSNNIATPLRRVAAQGGASATVTQIAAGMHMFPLFLPDGRSFLYLQTEKPAGTYLGGLDGQPTRLLQTDFSSVAWAPPQAGSKIGHLLSAREGALMAQPFDPQTFQPAGDGFLVAGNASIPNLFHASVSVSSNGVLVYLAGAGLEKNQLVWYDRAGKPLEKVGAPGPMVNFALSPDEKTVAAPLRTGSGDNSDIWLHELARGRETRFTFDSAGNNEPVWSPDGRRLVYFSTRSGVIDLYLKDTSGASQDEPLLKAGPPRIASDWSSDGKFVIYNHVGAKTASDLWVVNMVGDRQAVPFLQTPFRETQGQFSPDGHWVAYASDETGRLEVYVRPFPSAPGKWKISIGGGELPRWRRDGKELFYLSPERRLMAAAVKASHRVQPMFEAETPQVLFETRVPSFVAGHNKFVYAVAADGKRFLISTASETAETPLTVVVNWLSAVKK